MFSDHNAEEVGSFDTGTSRVDYKSKKKQEKEKGNQWDNYRF
jgi:hypothetical protein